MKTPGFTAEAGLRPARPRTFRAVSGRGWRNGRSVTPQAMSIGFCQADCPPGDYLCLWRCMEQGGGGGGPTPPTQTCRPACGPCQSDPDSPTGRSRFCIRRNCDDYTRNC